jgi:hypothetical protein
MRLVARVHNAGEAPAPTGVKVAFYQGAPSGGGQRLGEAELTAPLPAGQDTDVTLTLRPIPEGLTEVWAVVDDDASGAGHVTECNEGNNATSATLGDSCTEKPNEPPVAVCRDVTLSADDSCQASASVDGGSSDPDEKPAPLSLSQSPTGPFGLGSHAVTLTATDGEASAMCMATVTVVDITAPTVSCPVSRELECQKAGAPLAYTVSASDACGPVSTTCTPPSGTTFPVGTTPITCTAMDAAGNKAACGFAVTVKDTQAPTPGADKALVLWPPNHQYVTVKLSDCAGAAFDACTGSLSLDTYGRIVRITSDEEEDANGNGDGRTCQDMVLDPSGTRAQLRAERSGGSDGRVYTLHYVVTDPSGHARPGQCSVRVPHDQSGSPAVDSGPAWCVGEGCPSEARASPRCVE